MSPEEFRRFGHEAIDWVADYLRDIREFPVLPDATPGDVAKQLPSAGPAQGEPMDAILRDFRELIVPGLAQWNHPRFHAYFSVSSSGAGILGELLCAAVNVNGMLWKSAPAATELEQVTLDWLRQWIGLPEGFFGIIYDTASMSSFHAIAAARELADPDVREKGMTLPLVLYTSEQSHSSIEKAALALGIGRRHVRKIPADEKFRMRVDLLRREIEVDRAAGRKPFCVVATVGTTSTSSIDPVPEIARIAEEHGLWLHVDASYAGSAAIVPEFQWILDGAEHADSLVLNPHKWMFTPIDLSAFYTRRPNILRRAFSLVPEYLKTADDGRALNYMDYGIQLGRRFRALKLWFVMRSFGRDGIAEILRGHVRWAQELASIIESHPDFEVAAPVPLSLICFRY
ncbi:MAG TPA: pyridoxal-dependent decarboxylase, partial [Bryobacteraceae bacterium]|nr:pyridoxal-dependent decarboxylase [Bryobacteraceae bacterium]